MSSDQPIYHGIRSLEFRDKIRSILKMGKLKEKYIKEITDPDGMKIYDMAFTHKTANESENYEFFELLGDSTANKAIVWYLSRRFPDLNCPKGVKTVARLKINLISKENFAALGKKLGFWDFVTLNQKSRDNQKNKILEDVFESFFGATEYLLDKNILRGAGYVICYNIIEKLFDEISISLKREDLYDFKTRLKELEDIKAYNISNIKYTQIPKPRGEQLTTSVLTIKVNNQMFTFEGRGALKPKAEQEAAKKAFKHLIKLGYKENQ